MSDPLLEREQTEIAAAYQRVFNPDFPEGRLVLDDILRAGGVLDAGDAHDSETSIVWRAGRRSLAVFILNRLAVSPSELEAARRRQALATMYGRNYFAQLEPVPL